MPTLRTEITIEDREITVVKKRHYVVRAHCAECGQEVSMITLSHAALLSFRDVETVHSWMQAGLVHFSTSASDKYLICLRSLCLM